MKKERVGKVEGSDDGPLHVAGRPRLHRPFHGLWNVKVDDGGGHVWLLGGGLSQMRSLGGSAFEVANN